MRDVLTQGDVMGHADEIPRRSFLGAVGAGFAAAVVGAKNAPSDLDTIFAGTKLDDQAGKLDIPKQFGKGQCLILFGFNGCPLCQKITNTVAATQKELLKNKLDVPIIVISTQPETDKPKVQEYLKTYDDAGVREFAEDTSTTRRNDLVNKLGGKSTPTDHSEKQRVLHIGLPESAEQAKEIQRKIFDVNKTTAANNNKIGFTKMTDNGLSAGSNRQHSRYICLFEDGEMKQVFAGLDKNFSSPDDFAQEVAKKVAETVKAKQTGRGRQ
jgi:cytochrome oxidase Cu insertion factor (SCO1/SenC/PrrC family)